MKSARTSGDLFTVWQNATNVNDGTKVASIAADGGAKFGGSVQAGGDPVSGLNKGLKLAGSGVITASRNGANNLFIGWNTDDTSKSTIALKANGSATFAQTVTAGGYSLANLPEL